MLEYQIASRIAKTIHGNPDENIENPLVKAKLNRESKFKKNIIIHYTYEKRFQHHKKIVHQLWNQTFDQTPVIVTRLIIGNKNRPNMKRQLIHRRRQQPAQ